MVLTVDWLLFLLAVVCTVVVDYGCWALLLLHVVAAAHVMLLVVAMSHFSSIYQVS